MNLHRVKYERKKIENCLDFVIVLQATGKDHESANDRRRRSWRS